MRRTCLSRSEDLDKLRHVRHTVSYGIVAQIREIPLNTGLSAYNRCMTFFGAPGILTVILGVGRLPQLTAMLPEFVHRQFISCISE